MVVTVQQPFSGIYTAIFTVRIIEQGADFKTVPASKIKGQCAGNTLNTFLWANRFCVFEVVEQRK